MSGARCDRCRCCRPVTPETTATGRVIGHLCARCHRITEGRMERAKRVLSDPAPRVKARSMRPKYERRHPTAHRIAREIPRELLALRTRLLAEDIAARDGVATSTAMKAVSLARAAA